MKSKISIKGYDLLGHAGTDGIRYAWTYVGSNQMLESAAFPQHRKHTYDNICGYTTSVSLGCVLRQMGYACKFCKTGSILRFKDFLSPLDIAKQNIFMVLSDINCSDHRMDVQSPREFAYMGQGEPGYSYTQLRLAIKLTDIVMEKLGQQVYRHIISTAGVPEMIEAYKNDLKSDFYKNRVTIHYSLHATEERQIIMPIDEKYSYHSVLDSMQDINFLSGEKPCIGILLFNEYSPRNSSTSYTNDLSHIKEILHCIDPERFRISFCEFNACDDVGTSRIYEQTNANSILEYAIKNGYESKLFSSFGKEESTACGMLGGKEPFEQAGLKWLELEKEAERLIFETYETYVHNTQSEGERKNV